MQKILGKSRGCSNAVALDNLLLYFHSAGCTYNCHDIDDESFTLQAHQELKGGAIGGKLDDFV